MTKNLLSGGTFVSLLISVAVAIPIDNNIIGDPTVNCLADSLSIDVKTAKGFGGRVFVKGYSQDSNCNLVGDGKSNFDFGINFNNCGLRRTREINGVSISATVVVSFHPIFITKVDRAYKLNCFYLEAKKSLSQQIDVSELTTQTVTRQTTMPVCRYEILSDGPSGKAVRYARIGDHVFHKWTCEAETPGIYCMKVHSCTVNDGQGGDPVLVLDSEGCEIDRFVLQNLDYSGDLSAGQSAHVFKFADKPSLHFNCQIELSLKDPKSGCRYLQPQCVGTNGVPSGNYDSESTSSYSQDASTARANNYNNAANDEYAVTTTTTTTLAYAPDHSAEIQQRVLPAAGYKVVPEKSVYNDFDSGYPTKSPNTYDQTQVAPSSRVSETQYEEYTPTAAPVVGYDPPQSPTAAALVSGNEFYQDETEAGPEAIRKSAKRHSIHKRKVADFDLPEQSLLVIEIDEDNTSHSMFDDHASDAHRELHGSRCISMGLFASTLAVTAVMAIVLLIAAARCIRLRRTDELHKFLSHKG